MTQDIATWSPSIGMSRAQPFRLSRAFVLADHMPVGHRGNFRERVQ